MEKNFTTSLSMKERADEVYNMNEIMDYIIKEIKWASHFPYQCHNRILKVCEAVKARQSLPFKK